MIQLLTGSNAFAIRDALDTRILAAREKLGNDAITIVDANELSLDDLPQLLLGVTLFASERLIVIRDAANKQLWEKLADMLPETAETTDVLLQASEVDKRTRTYKWLQKNAEVHEIELLNEAELVKWLQAIAQKMKLDLDTKTARYLVEYVGTDQWRLKQDLEKLHLSGRSPSPELIRDVIEPNPQASVFQLLDAVFAGRAGQVEQHLQVLRGSEEPYRFMGLLANQMYALLLCANAGNKDTQAIAKDAGIHPFVVRKLQPTARKLSRTDQQRIVDTLADLDRQLKTTGHDPWTLIQIAFTNLET